MKTARLLFLVLLAGSASADDVAKPVELTDAQLEKLTTAQNRIGTAATELRLAQAAFEVQLRDIALELKLDLDTHELKLAQAGGKFGFAVKPPKPKAEEKKPDAPVAQK